MSDRREHGTTSGTVPSAASARLERGMGLLPATATNIISMVGIGPFLTIPVMIGVMNGPHVMYAWVAGAFIALCDGLVYAHLGAAACAGHHRLASPRKPMRPVRPPAGVGSDR